MTQTYKHFKKDEEIFFGLSFITLVKLALLVSGFIFISFHLRLSLNSFAFLLLALVCMVIIAFIVKTSLDDEVPGHYSSILYHPFQNHIFPLHKNKEQFQSISDLQPIKSIEKDYLIDKDNNLIAVLKLNNGISIQSCDEAKKKQIHEAWSSILERIKSINLLDSYFLTNTNSGDSISCFIEINKELYKTKPFHSDQENLNFASDIHETWYRSKLEKKENFIASKSFYLLIKELHPENKAHPIFKTINKITKKSFDIDAEQEILLKEKLDAIQSSFKSIGIGSNPLQDKALDDFANKYLPLNKILNNEKLDFFIEDKAKYLELNKEAKKQYYKTYRLSISPQEDSSESLDFWLEKLFSKIKCQAFISMHIKTRDYKQDRRKAESKAEYIKKYSKNTKASTLALIKENQLISQELIEHFCSFDISILISVYSSDLKEIQKIDNHLKDPVYESKIANLDRLQMQNWLYSLPYACENLCNKSKIFSGFSFARACFPFIDYQFGTKTGFLQGFALHNNKPIFLDEYQHEYFHNRAINFIGDSGSGKTVAAKLSIKRRLKDPKRSFYIIDNTADGWSFFINYLGGIIIDIDKASQRQEESLFAPFVYNGKQDFNKHLEDLINLLAFIKYGHNKISNQERSFLSHSLNNLYKKSLHKDICISDYYESLSKSLDNRASDWLEDIAPYCKKANGIYSSLLDGTNSNIDTSNRLILFCFSKIEKQASYAAPALFLISNFISKKISLEKQAGISLVIDEAWKIFESDSSGKELLSHLARAGRGLDLGLWTISQKPSDLPAEIHSSASCSLCFQMKEIADRSLMAKYANLNSSEQKLLESTSLHQSGTALVKLSKNSGLMKLSLDPVEKILCNSTRDFSNYRESLFNRYKSNQTDNQKAALLSVEEILKDARKLTS